MRDGNTLSSSTSSLRERPPRESSKVAPRTLGLMWRDEQRKEKERETRGEGPREGRGEEEVVRREREPRERVKERCRKRLSLLVESEDDDS